eukprot:TRINITY_DN26853_c0_g1_i1.p1 TRINITY_DN26853_c0_g1~~TRINITY_DN26853_c0_g1_i1.p1  ORF type:complete len:368 (-),score=49.64 TRINITY_DN26853_c0_g1_i1:131-1234(-)
MWLNLRTFIVLAFVVVAVLHFLPPPPISSSTSEHCSDSRLIGATHRNANVAQLSTGGSQASSAPRFLLYRIIGNNMPPLQCPSQLLWNTEYALRHEPELHDCEKRWVLNQIMNATERALLIDAFLEHGFTSDDIIIRRLNVSKVAAQKQAVWADHVTAQNEARNVAIEDGIRRGARWILPFDGNHFLTEEAWASIERSADEADARDYKYFKVPVHRLHRQQQRRFVNGSSLFADLKSHAPIMIESQLAFRYDATERFQEGMVYGMQNKLELLARACGNPEDATPGTPFQERCGCSNLGREGQPHDSDPATAAKCGYSLRLWFYPCEGVDAKKVFYNGMYRKRLRKEARNQLYSLVKKVVRNPHLLEP